MKVKIEGIRKMITYVELPDLMPDYIRELFKGFDYKLPFYNYDSKDDKNNLIVEREVCDELISKIEDTTGFFHGHFKYLIDTQKEEFIDNIYLLDMARENNNKLKYADFMNNIIIAYDDIPTFEYDYVYITPFVEINCDESLCDSFEDTSAFALKIYGSKRKTEAEYLESIMPYYNDALRRLEKAKAQKEQKEKENLKETNQKLEDIKSFSKNYEKYASSIDELIKSINDNSLSYNDLEDFGNIGKWAKIKIKNDL